ncbi:alpha/beta hydrolase [Amylibacter sp. SFDW26]|uniref:alpha/beta hydrolase n=1 Tax=Amylibacter sp. SFDW26 TaxID=2652722 RepID=UPI0012615C11|nr:alpha/beta hydrolase [Amylibacter sp. SFDW26]KAB7615921.1 alpha/beta hydrolase [Amylibacter sp. SFDW26]
MLKSIVFSFSVGLFGLFAQTTLAQEKDNYDFPDISKINPNQKYVIYSHGLIVEGTDPRPIHPKFGLYDFPAIKEQLAKRGDFELIAIQRPKGEKIPTQVMQLVKWVEKLTEHGVPAENVTLIGFSRGGDLTARAASQLKPLPVNTVLLATCWDDGVKDDPEINITGRLLSIYEVTDGPQSCVKIKEHSPKLQSFEEIKINTGKSHGAFYMPDSAWMEPLLMWVTDR